MFLGVQRFSSACNLLSTENQRVTTDMTVMSLCIDAYETENVKLINWSARPKSRSFTCLSFLSSIGEETVRKKGLLLI